MKLLEKLKEQITESDDIEFQEFLKGNIKLTVSYYYDGEDLYDNYFMYQDKLYMVPESNWLIKEIENEKIIPIFLMTTDRNYFMSLEKRLTLIKEKREQGLLFKSCYIDGMIDCENMTHIMGDGKDYPIKEIQFLSSALLLDKKNDFMTFEEHKEREKKKWRDYALKYKAQRGRKSPIKNRRRKLSY